MSPRDIALRAVWVQRLLEAEAPLAVVAPKKAEDPAPAPAKKVPLNVPVEKGK